MHGMSEWESVGHFTFQEQGACVDRLEFMVDGERTRMAVWPEGHDPVPLDPSKLVNVLWLDGQRVLFWGAFDKPGVDPNVERVLLDTPGPGGNIGIPAGILPSVGSEQDDVRWAVWLFGPTQFNPGEVKVRWQAKRRSQWHTVREERCPLWRAAEGT